MKVTFILPCVGRRRSRERYVRSWSMEPLAMAVLAARTPPEVERVFCDDRFDAIPFEEPTDLVALSVETYTARRAYQIAGRFRRRGVPVVMGGFHPTLAPEDAAAHADAIVIGEAEETWPRLLADFSAGRLQPRYTAERRPPLDGLRPDRSLYAGKPYLPVSLVETARGCPHACDFCSISRFYRRSWTARPVADVIAEIRTLPHRSLFFTDDNFTADRERTRALLQALMPLKVHWAAQIALDAAEDAELLDLMRCSGCVFVLIGFESLDPQRLAAMGKGVNRLRDYEEAARRLARAGIGVYGTFVFGYDGDTAESFRRTEAFARRNGFFFTAFNHVVPFPGTPLYERLEREGRLREPKWWLAPDARFGQVTFVPEGLAPAELTRLSYQYRRRFYSLPSIARRLRNWRANGSSPRRALIYLLLNLMTGLEVRRRQDLPLGAPEDG